MEAETLFIGVEIVGHMPSLYNEAEREKFRIFNLIIQSLVLVIEK